MGKIKLIECLSVEELKQLLPLISKKVMELVEAEKATALTKLLNATRKEQKTRTNRKE